MAPITTVVHPVRAGHVEELLDIRRESSPDTSAPSLVGR